MAHKTMEYLYHIIIMHMLNVILKGIEAIFRDAIMEETTWKKHVTLKLMY